MKLILLTNADLYSPKHEGKADLLSCGTYILKIGKIDQKALAQTKLEIKVVDVKGNFLIPGIIDPHEHLLGGSGENGGFSSQTPEIALSEIVQGGITTVVGTLGADTKMKTMPGLLAKVKGMNDEGLSAYLYTGGYTVPPTTIMASEKEDIMFIDEVIGTGEIAIADERSDEPKAEKLARIAVDTHMGGMLANKAGVTHFHVGEGRRRLSCIKELMDFAPEIKYEWLYPTHIERSEKLIEEAIQLTKRGSHVDMDVSEGGLAKALATYNKHNGSLKKLTISSDASKKSPKKILKELRDCIFHHRFKLETLLPLVTSNTADVLKFEKKGRILVDMEPSYVVLDKKDLELTHVVSKGKFLMEDSKICVREKFLEDSEREIHLVGDHVRSRS